MDEKHIDKLIEEIFAPETEAVYAMFKHITGSEMTFEEYKKIISDKKNKTT